MLAKSVKYSYVRIAVFVTYPFSGTISLAFVFSLRYTCAKVQCTKIQYAKT